MKVKLISVGNSKAIRLPKAFIKQLGDAREVELEIQDQTVIVRSPKPIRQGWAAAFARAAATEKINPPSRAAAHLRGTKRNGLGSGRYGIIRADRVQRSFLVRILFPPLHVLRGRVGVGVPFVTSQECALNEADISLSHPPARLYSPNQMLTIFPIRDGPGSWIKPIRFSQFRFPGPRLIADGRFPVW